eukprot:5379460-Amphidinium_carterae.2
MISCTVAICNLAASIDEDPHNSGLVSLLSHANLNTNDLNASNSLTVSLSCLRALRERIIAGSLPLAGIAFKCLPQKSDSEVSIFPILNRFCTAA